MLMMENNINVDDHHLLSSVFQVIFFDGEREHDKGYVHITPSLTFKEFQSILREKLETSPHQITIYFERHNNNNHNHNYNQNLAQYHRRRHPVTSKFDFGSIIPEFNTSFFWVVQKRSRRTRRRKPKNFNINYPMENFALLRRNQHQQNNNFNDYSPLNNVSDFEYMEYVNRMRLRLDRERYLMSMDLNSTVYDDLSCFFGGQYGNFSDDGASSSGGGSSIDYTNSNTNRGSGFCDVCYYNAVRGETMPFHCCKNDVVTQIFRSPAGPIGPPKKTHILG